MTVRKAALTFVLLVALGGCAAGGGDDAAGGKTHTMPDGTVMDGPTHIHDDSHSHGEEAGADAEDIGPSEAARMVCSGQVVDDVTRIMGLDEPAEPSSSWKKPVFSCEFDLASGPLVLTVHDATDRGEGAQHFRTMQASRSDSEPIKGVYSLGLPAYETADGTVAFVREGKTLEVDATGLTGPAGEFGSQGDLTRTEIAYAVATSVLACWTEHS